MITMPRTREQLEQAARDAEQWLDDIEAGRVDVTVEDTADLRRVGLAVIDRDKAEREIADAVRSARDNGRDWGQIGAVLGVTKQSARERFGKPVGRP
ncbi:MAG: hypothetical protein L0I76_09250 [Pseudonocardia sp.]|nr:hypothetical protein [Pseudonocardia sp.]